MRDLKRFLKQRLTGDVPRNIKWSYLVLSLAMSIALWFYVTVQDNPVVEQLFDVPINYTNLQDGMAISDKVETARVRISGNANIMDEITVSNIDISADLAGLDLGSHTVRLKVDLPGGVQLVSIDHNEVMLIIERLAETQKPVKVYMAGTDVADGFTALDPVLMPEVVVLSGSSDKLALVDSVYVSVDIGGADENYRTVLPVNVVDANGNSLLSWVTPQPAAVDVLVPVVSDLPSKVVPVRVTISGAPAAGYMVSRIVIDPAVATVYAPQNVLDSLDYVYTSAVNIGGATNNVKDDVTLLSVDGATIDASAKFGVVVVVERQRTVTLHDVTVSLSRANSNYDYQLETNTVDVTVRGPVSVLNNMTNIDIEARVDVGSLAPGEAEVEVQLSTGQNVEIRQATPAVINVSVSRKE